MEKNVSKGAKCCQTNLWVHEFFFVRFLVFESWTILYFTFVVHSGLRRIHKKIYVRGLSPQAPVSTGGWGLSPQAPIAFGLNSPSWLVFGYHWLAFLNQVPSSLLTIVTYKNRPHLKKLKIAFFDIFGWLETLEISEP